jgi:hypothetical protein
LGSWGSCGSTKTGILKKKKTYRDTYIHSKAHNSFWLQPIIKAHYKITRYVLDLCLRYWHKACSLLSPESTRTIAIVS